MAVTSRTDERLTYDDLARMPDDGMRHEIIDGVHYVTPAPVPRHQQLLGRLVLITPLLPGFAFSIAKLFRA